MIVILHKNWGEVDRIIDAFACKSHRILSLIIQYVWCLQKKVRGFRMWIYKSSNLTSLIESTHSSRKAIPAKLAGFVGYIKSFPNLDMEVVEIRARIEPAITLIQSRFQSLLYCWPCLKFSLLVHPTFYVFWFVYNILPLGSLITAFMSIYLTLDSIDTMRCSHIEFILNIRIILWIGSCSTLLSRLGVLGYIFSKLQKKCKNYKIKFSLKFKLY